MHEKNKPEFIGCDWGSSNFRLALLTEDCRIIGAYDDSGGVLTLRQGGADTEGLVRHLREGLALLSNASGCESSGIPVVISGMAGSSLGIIEVPYVPLPFRPGKGGLELFDAGPLSGIPNPVHIIPGICGPDDVMRGEETEAAGLMDGLILQDARIILPGTHSKHLRVRDGQVDSFKTYMTGELFRVIASQTILARALEDPKADPFDEHGRACFLEGLRMSGSSDLLHELFTLRSRVLLDQINVKGNIHRLSGLLIGEELRGLSSEPECALILGGAGALNQRYRIALEFLYGRARIFDIPESTRNMAVWKGQCLIRQSGHH